MLFEDGGDVGVGGWGGPTFFFGAWEGDGLATGDLATGDLQGVEFAVPDPAVVRGGTLVGIGELETFAAGAALEVERLVGVEFVEAGELVAWQEHGAEVGDGFGGGGEVFLIASGRGELQQRPHGGLAFATADGGGLELTAPHGLHVGVVLLRPGGLRIGHLREQEEVAAAFGGIEVFLIAAKLPGEEQGAHQGGVGVVIEHIAAGEVLRPLARPVGGVVGGLDGILFDGRRKGGHVIEIRAPTARRILRHEEGVQCEVGGGFDFGVLAAERVIDPHEQPRGGLGDIVVVGGVVFLVLTTPVVPASLTRDGLRAWNGSAIGLAAVILRFAAFDI